MTATILIVPSIGGSTSSDVLPPIGPWSTTLTMVDDIGANYDRDETRSQILDRLAALREQGAHRERTMPWTDDSAELIQELANQTAAFRDLQLRTGAWTNDNGP